MATNNNINGSSKLTIFNSSQTWTPDPRSNFVTIIGWGAANGGGSGRQGSSTAAGGGAGSAGGGMLYFNAPASYWNSAGETITIPAGGAGGGAGVPDGRAQLRAVAGPHHRAGQRALTDGRRDAARRVPGPVARRHTICRFFCKRYFFACSAGIASRSCRAARARGRAA